MENMTYFSTLRDTTVQFMNCFDNMNIYRYNKDGTVNKTISVNLKYAPKEKAYYFIHQENKGTRSFQLPLISIFPTSIDYDPTRARDIRWKTMIQTTASSASPSGNFVLTPVPYNAMYQVNIWSKYSEDIFQIMERIFTWTVPNFYIALKEPLTEEILNLKVIPEGGGPEFQMEYGQEDYGPVLRWSLNYNVQTWLYKPVDTQKLIKYLNINTYVYNSSTSAASTSANSRLYATTSLSGNTVVEVVGGDRILDYEEETTEY